jgi:diketogulonate reductase-like aldo/keto reductase
MLQQLSTKKGELQMISKETFTMYNGVEIPKVALGTWQTPDEISAQVVKYALSAGYLHIDTAIGYQNEVGVGNGIKQSTVDRKDIFVTSKIPAEVKTYEGAKKAIDESLERLGTDYLDLMLIHAPKPWNEMFCGCEKTYFEENLAVWKAMEEAYKAGKLRSIGVSNFEVSDLKNIIENAEIKPMANQIRIHIGHVPTEVMDFCKANEILVEAYSPNATGRLANNPEIVAMAEKYGVSVSQLGNRFDLQLGTIVLPKSTHEEYIKENLSLDFTVSEQDMEILSKISE